MRELGVTRTGARRGRGALGAALLVAGAGAAASLGACRSVSQAQSESPTAKVARDEGCAGSLVLHVRNNTSTPVSVYAYARGHGEQLGVAAPGRADFPLREIADAYTAYRVDTGATVGSISTGPIDSGHRHSRASDLVFLETECRTS